MTDLSKREKQITDLLIAGQSTGEIGAALGISPHTVRNHLKACFRKLGVGSQSALVARLLSTRGTPPDQGPPQSEVLAALQRIEQRLEQSEERLGLLLRSLIEVWPPTTPRDAMGGEQNQ